MTSAPPHVPGGGTLPGKSPSKLPLSYKQFETFPTIPHPTFLAPFQTTWV
jgi:hypothetical protein